MLASGCVIVLLTTLIVKVPAPDSFNPETGFSEKERRKDRRILIRIFSAIGLTALWFIPIRNTEWFEALIEKRRPAYEAAANYRVATDQKTSAEIAEEILEILEKEGMIS